MCFNEFWNFFSNSVIELSRDLLQPESSNELTQNLIVCHIKIISFQCVLVQRLMSAFKGVLPDFSHTEASCEETHTQYEVWGKK